MLIVMMMLIVILEGPMSLYRYIVHHPPDKKKLTL